MKKSNEPQLRTLHQTRAGNNIVSLPWVATGDTDAYSNGLGALLLLGAQNHIPLDPRQPTSPEIGAASDSFEFVALAEARNYRLAIAKRFAPHLKGDVLEIGAGVGQMLREVAAVCQPLSLTAVEPDSRFVDLLRGSVADAEVCHGSEMDLPAEHTFDAIYSVNVLEHIEDDDAEIARWHGRLRPGGTLCLLVPARRELYAAIDRDFGHHRRYGKSDLQIKLSRAGFAIHSVTYFNFAGYFAWLAIFKLLGKRSFNPISVRFYDRFVFPMTNVLENAIGACPLGQSLIAVARK